MSPVIRIDTRSSPMALAQAHHVADQLRALHPDLAALGGKGAFVREIEERLLRKDIDLAVHCLKDAPGDAPPPRELRFSGYLPHEDPRDALITNTGTPLAELPPDDHPH